MKSIQTEIIINATAEKVWGVLMAFENYPQWNPFIKSLTGAPEVGNTIRAELKNGEGVSVFKPKVLTVNANSKFEWRGSLPVPGLFIGQHYFVIEPVEAGRVKFIHGENFSGLLAGLIMNKIGAQTMQGFIAMNKALKEQAES